MHSLLHSDTLFIFTLNFSRHTFLSTLPILQNPHLFIQIPLKLPLLSLSLLSLLLLQKVKQNRINHAARLQAILRFPRHHLPQQFTEQIYTLRAALLPQPTLQNLQIGFAGGGLEICGLAGGFLDSAVECAFFFEEFESEKAAEL